MEAEQLSLLRKKLEEEKQEFLDQIAGLEKTLATSLGESTGELSVCDNHPGDIGDELFERSKDIGLRDNAQVLLEEVDDAFRKMDEGTYGWCRVCGQQIPIERLEAIVWATECIHCQSKEDAADVKRRPVEELILTPPFERTLLADDPLNSMDFAGEDALRTVMGYGSSDTPQDITGSHDYKDVFLNSHEEEGIIEK